MDIIRKDDPSIPEDVYTPFGLKDLGHQVVVSVSDVGKKIDL